MIEHTKKLVEEKFTTMGGYEHNAEVQLYLYIFICEKYRVKFLLIKSSMKFYYTSDLLIEILVKFLHALKYSKLGESKSVVLMKMFMKMTS